jgi:hypothetical protein
LSTYLFLIVLLTKRQKFLLKLNWNPPYWYPVHNCKIHGTIRANFFLFYYIFIFFMFMKRAIVWGHTFLVRLVEFNLSLYFRLQLWILSYRIIWLFNRRYNSYNFKLGEYHFSSGLAYFLYFPFLSTSLFEWSCIQSFFIKQNWKSFTLVRTIDEGSFNFSEDLILFYFFIILKSITHSNWGIDS